MATLPQIETPQPRIAEIPRRSPVVPIKVGIFGGQGSGKTTSAAMLALALSIEFHSRAPVFVTDTEPGWQFLRPIFAAERVELIQRTVPTFRAMLADLREAEKLGASVWAIDSATVIWQELMQSFKAKNGGEIPINVWGDLKQLWGEYTTRFLNSSLHCFALGRLGNVMEYVENEKRGKNELVKTGTAFKAGGSESFGYEPHLLIEMSLERKAKKKAGNLLEGEGRMIHRCDVLKDRTWALNGAVIRWSDKAKYEPGGYRMVWNSLKPHFDSVQQTMQLVKIETGHSSTELISDDGNSEFYRMRQRKEVLSAEIKACLDLFLGGRKQEDVEARIAVSELIFGVKSKEAADALSLEKLERGLRILQTFQKNVAPPVGMPDTKAGVLTVMAEAIREYDRGDCEIELPF